MSSHTRLRAFTLIEILVVVAIIALLLAVLLPSLARAKEQALIVVCQGRLRELYAGHNYYAHDNRNQFPHWQWWLWDGGNEEKQSTFVKGLYAKSGGVRPTDSSKWVEFGQIYRYLKNKELYFCPKDNRARFSSLNSIGGGGSLGKRPISSYTRFLEPHYWLGLREYGGTCLDSKLNGADFINPDRMRPGQLVPASIDIKPLGPFATTPDRMALLFEEYSGTELTKQLLNPGTYALNDAIAGFFLPGYTQDRVSQRHFGQFDLAYWDGHVVSADGQKFNRYSSTPYCGYIAFGGPRVYKP